MAASRRLAVLLLAAGASAAADCPADECDTDAFLQVRNARSAHGLAEEGFREGALSTGVLKDPEEFTRNSKSGGGTFVVYNFSLAFDDYRAYWRRFGVDVPTAKAMKKCPPEGCPVLLDFPGSSDTIYTQRAWTRWFKYQEETDAPYILITMEGSPDAVMSPGTRPYDVLPCTNSTPESVCRSPGYLSTGGTSWNVLGWGRPSPPVPTRETPRPPRTADVARHWAERHGDPSGLYPGDGEGGGPGAGGAAPGREEAGALAEEGRSSGAAGDGGGDLCKKRPSAACFAPALLPWNAYQCYGTHLAADPLACANASKGLVDTGVAYPMISRKKCASASGANDWDYVRSVLHYVTESPLCSEGGWCGNRDRIYFTGQSMGGMSSIQFAVPQSGDKYNMGPYSPKAIAACSAGGSRNNEASLKGTVPTLLMQGFKDSIAPGTVWGGYNRNDPYRGKDSYLIRGNMFAKMWQNDSLVQQGLRLLGKNRDVPLESQQGMRTNILLNADTQTGGKFLASHTRKAAAAGIIGCQDNLLHAPMAIGGDSYMWETFGTTLARVAGAEVDMERLSYQIPVEFEEAASAIDLACANVTRTAGSQAEIQACTFRGGHTYPWIDSYTSRQPESLHKFVWEWWFKGGTRV